jgi:hypothetical protein
LKILPSTYPNHFQNAIYNNCSHLCDDIDTDKTTIKVPVFENTPEEAVLRWWKQFLELNELKGFHHTKSVQRLSCKANEQWKDSKDSVAPNIAPDWLTVNILKRQ